MGNVQGYGQQEPGGVSEGVNRSDIISKSSSKSRMREISNNTTSSKAHVIGLGKLSNVKDSVAILTLQAEKTGGVIPKVPCTTEVLYSFISYQHQKAAKARSYEYRNVDDANIYKQMFTILKETHSHHFSQKVPVPQNKMPNKVEVEKAIAEGEKKFEKADSKEELKIGEIEEGVSEVETSTEEYISSEAFEDEDFRRACSDIRIDLCQSQGCIFKKHPSGELTPATPQEIEQLKEVSLEIFEEALRNLGFVIKEKRKVEVTPLKSKGSVAAPLKENVVQESSSSRTIAKQIDLMVPRMVLRGMREDDSGREARAKEEKIIAADEARRERIRDEVKTTELKRTIIKGTVIHRQTEAEEINKVSQRIIEDVNAPFSPDVVLKGTPASPV